MNLDHLTDGTLKPGNPDLFDGARPEQLERRIRTEISDRIQPTTQDDSPIIPTFFLAAKGPDGSGAVAKRQACYDGALGARGIHSVQSYGQDELNYDDNAYTITSTYSDGQLKMFTSHSAQHTSGRSLPEYYMTHVRSFAMTDTAETFRREACTFRNARDWAKEQRDEAIKLANAEASGSEDATRAMQSSSGPTSSFHSETSEDKLYIAQTTSQESRTSLNADSYTNAHPQESESSMDELAIALRPRGKPTKRRSKRPRRS